MRLGKPQALALGTALVVVVLLILAPRIPAGKKEAAQVDPLKLRTAEAVALVNGPDPMRGIMMLRELAEEDPGNAEVQWHLGMFSAQSGQFDKAAERLRKVLELDEAGYQDAWFYLGHVYAALDSIDQALECLGTYRTLLDDPERIAELDRSMEKLANEKR